MVGRINARFSDLDWRPVHYFYRSFNIDQLAALYNLSHVALITPRRDGMNLVCKEYIAAKRDCAGVLILSEMAGASKELYDAILVNPNDVDEIVKALEDAFAMPEEEQKQHIRNMQYILKTYDIHNWVSLFLERLNFLKNQQQNMNLRLIDDALIVRIRRDYRLARNRIILIDLDDLLLEEEMITRYKSRIEKVNVLYEYLTQETRNIVITSSGTDVHTLEHLVGNFSTDLIAEHGAIYREYGQAWNVLEKVSLEWKNEIFSLLEHFVRRTPGSFIEEKEFSLVWHYSKAEKGLGEVRTRELNEHLRFLANSLNLQILEGRRTLEIKTVQVRKGRAIQRWLNKYPYDFVLAIGVGNHLEDVFMELPENSYSIKIGKGIQSHSSYQVPTVHEALLRLEEIWC
jgi:trehalose 6-phosphate synthase/phosphatase